MYYLFNKSNGEYAESETRQGILETLEYFVNELCEDPDDMILVNGEEVVIEVVKMVNCLDHKMVVIRED
jgi:hypothetical protein